MRTAHSGQMGSGCSIRQGDICHNGVKIHAFAPSLLGDCRSSGFKGREGNQLLRNSAYRQEQDCHGIACPKNVLELGIYLLLAGGSGSEGKLSRDSPILLSAFCRFLYHGHHLLSLSFMISRNFLFTGTLTQCFLAIFTTVPAKRSTSERLPASASCCIDGYPSGFSDLRILRSASISASVRSMPSNFAIAMTSFIAFTMSSLAGPGATAPL